MHSCAQRAVALAVPAVSILVLAVACDRTPAADTGPKGPPIRINLGDFTLAELAQPLRFSVERGPVQVSSVAEKPVLRDPIPAAACELGLQGGQLAVDGTGYGTQVRLGSAHGLPFTLSLSGSQVEYRGVLDAFYYGDFVRLVNELSLEEYLAGVLARETGGESFKLEALKAQAIAARTFTLYKLKSELDRWGFLPPEVAFPATSVFQSYGGAGEETELIRRAVRETEGAVLTYEGKLFAAYHHSTCGGQTAAGRLLGEQDIPPLRGVTCGFCADAPCYRWSVSLSRADLDDVLRAWAAAQNIPMGNVLSLASVDRMPSQHSPYLRVEHSTGAFEMRMDHFRALVNREFREAVLSTAFDVSIEPPSGAAPDAVRFSGHGYGHGVGLCQSGASTMARDDRTAGEILARYFPESGKKWIY